SAEACQGPARTATQACVGTDDTVSGRRAVASRTDVILGDGDGVLSEGPDEREAVHLCHGRGTSVMELGGRVVPRGHWDFGPVPCDETPLGRGPLPVCRGECGGKGVCDASSANAAARQGWLCPAQLPPAGQGASPEGGEKGDRGGRDYVL